MKLKFTMDESKLSTSVRRIKSYEVDGSLSFDTVSEIVWP